MFYTRYINTCLRANVLCLLHNFSPTHMIAQRQIVEEHVIGEVSACNGEKYAVDTHRFFLAVSLRRSTPTKTAQFSSVIFASGVERSLFLSISFPLDTSRCFPIPIFRPFPDDGITTKSMKKALITVYNPPNAEL